MKKTPKPRDTVQRLKETIHKQPAVFAVYVALRLIVLAELVMSIIRGEYESAFICLLVLALFIPVSYTHLIRSSMTTTLSPGVSLPSIWFLRP